MRTILLIMSGVILCLVVEAGVSVFQKMREPLQPIRNDGYDLVQVANESGTHLFDLHRGESKPLEYGTYRVTIPSAKISFSIWKNDKGFCGIHAFNGFCLVETGNYATISGD